MRGELFQPNAEESRGGGGLPPPPTKVIPHLKNLAANPNVQAQPNSLRRDEILPEGE